MATAPNPLVSAVQARLSQLQGGAPTDAPGSPTSTGEDSVGSQLAQQSSELHGADPALILKQLTKIREALGVMFIQTFQAVPGVAGHVSKTLGTLDRAIKEAQNAAQTAIAVRPPVGLSLASQGPNGPQGPSAQSPF